MPTAKNMKRMALPQSTTELNPEVLSEVGSAARFTEKEAAVFRRLAESEGNLVPRSTLLGVLRPAAPRTLDTYIRNMRKKLSATGDRYRIETEVGKGYILKKTAVRPV